ncbi:unnamed protein product [Rotaria sordida]|uniref:NHL repeat-containing protein n=1 Tax=Rotaria sordida TaxID=392033 RepID=A0A815EXJ2_9BILA|nr:unnamed protein product [Rotaria sordida]
MAGIMGVSGSSPDTSAIGFCYYIFVDSNENLYVSDDGNHRVIRYLSNSSSGMAGVVVAGDGTRGTSASQLSAPQGVFVNEAGTLYIVDSLNHRIQKWNNGASSGVTVAGTRVSGNSLSELSYPTGIVVDSNGYMYIVDYGNNRILRWPPNSNSGECIGACTGVSGNGMDTLNYASALAFDSYGSLFVSDGSNNRVQKFQILSGFDETSTTTMTTTAITATDHTTSLQTSSKSSSTHSSTIAISIALLLWFLNDWNLSDFVFRLPIIQ